MIWFDVWDLLQKNLREPGKVVVGGVEKTELAMSW